MQNQSQVSLPKLTFLNKWIIILSAFFYILDNVFLKFQSVSISNLLGLTPERFFNGHFYLLFTYPFFSNSFIGIILNSLMLWLMGSDFESLWGRKRYFQFLLTVVLGGGFLFLSIVFLFFSHSPLLHFALIGVSGIITSLCIAYAIIFPDRVFSFMFIFPIKAKYFCLILIAMTLHEAFLGPYGAGAWGQLGGAFFGYLFMIFVSNKNIKMLSLKYHEVVGKRFSKKSNAKLSIVKNDTSTPPKYWQ